MEQQRLALGKLDVRFVGHLNPLPRAGIGCRAHLVHRSLRSVFRRVTPAVRQSCVHRIHDRAARASPPMPRGRAPRAASRYAGRRARSEENTSELQSLMRISYAVFCLKKKTYEDKSTK